MTERWQQSKVPRGAEYDRRFEDLAATGMDMHGEAALVASYRPTAVLDAGCGTGRVAIELASRGHDVVGVDVDPAMLGAAQAKAPRLTWVAADLTDPAFDLGRTFDVVVMAGNVLIFVPSGTEEKVIANTARHVSPGGRLVAGYSLRPGGLQPSGHDAYAAAAGLVLEDRWSSWDRDPYVPTDNYAVSVHRKPG
ncbi:MAG TPA: class I SAM-dependent methyltransferase [Acidimicrobiales bacterium]|nr:class I SAM-dependent methyltransferase [Acidimicrobiales bacterium]